MRPASIFLIIQLSNSRVIHDFFLDESLGKEEFEYMVNRCYTLVFDSCWKKKSLYPLYLLGCRDFYRCFEL